MFESCLRNYRSPIIIGLLSFWPVLMVIGLFCFFYILFFFHSYFFCTFANSINNVRERWLVYYI